MLDLLKGILKHSRSYVSGHCMEMEHSDVLTLGMRGKCDGEHRLSRNGDVTSSPSSRHWRQVEKFSLNALRGLFSRVIFGSCRRRCYCCCTLSANNPLNPSFSHHVFSIMALAWCGRRRSPKGTRQQLGVHWQWGLYTRRFVECCFFLWRNEAWLYLLVISLSWNCPFDSLYYCSFSAMDGRQSEPHVGYILRGARRFGHCGHVAHVHVQGHAFQTNSVCQWCHASLEYCSLDCGSSRSLQDSQWWSQRRRRRQQSYGTTRDWLWTWR